VMNVANTYLDMVPYGVVIVKIPICLSDQLT